jgi:hypothetical protein
VLNNSQPGVRQCHVVISLTEGAQYAVSTGWRMCLQAVLIPCAYPFTVRYVLLHGSASSAAACSAQTPQSLRRAVTRESLMAPVLLQSEHWCRAGGDVLSSCVSSSVTMCSLWICLLPQLAVGNSQISPWSRPFD